MEKEAQQKSTALGKIFSSKLLHGKNRNHKLAYIAVITALLVVVNMFFEFKFMDVQFSLTIVASALSGIMIGPFFGFVACFIGDLVGFLYNSGGYTYMPWIGLSMSLTSLFAGVVFNVAERETRLAFFIKTLVVCLLSLFVCTIGINTTAFWLLYSPTTPYATYVFARLFLKGQIFNCLFNYLFLFIGTPALIKLLSKKRIVQDGV